MPRLYDEPENEEPIEVMSQLFQEATSAAFSRQMSPPPNPLHSPADSQVSSANRFASLVHSPVSPAYKSARSSTRSSLARQSNGVGDKPKSPAQPQDVKEGGELSPVSTEPRQSSRIRLAPVQTKPAKKAPSTVKRELRPKGKVDAKGAVRKVGRPAKTVTVTATAQRRGRGRPAKKATETKATVSVQGGRNEWEVEKIVDSRIEEETLEHFFRVKWKGFSDKDNTWEPKKNLANCKSLIEAYEKKVGK